MPAERKAPTPPDPRDSSKAKKEPTMSISYTIHTVNSNAKYRPPESDDPEGARRHHAALVIALKYGLPLRRAELVAQLAGIGKREAAS
jgi:hypothetical protein